MTYRKEPITGIIYNEETVITRYIQEMPDAGVIMSWEAENVKCPYGNVGDIIWVKENFWAYGKWVQDGKKKIFAYYGDKHHVKFGASKPANQISFSPDVYDWHKRPSLFLFREDARIFLEIKNIRVERVQDIPEQDAMAEAAFPMIFHQSTERFEDIDPLHVFYDRAPAKFRTGFEFLWNKINGKRASWESNPFVFVVEFKHLKNYGR